MLPPKTLVEDAGRDIEKRRQLRVIVASDGVGNAGPAEQVADKHGTCTTFLAHEKRWRVKLDDGTAMLLPSSFLTDVETGQQLQDPIRAAAWSGSAGQHALYAAVDFRAADVLFEEAPLFLTGGGCTWEQGCISAVEDFFALSEDHQSILLKLHAEECFSVCGVGRSRRRQVDGFRDPFAPLHMMGQEEVLARTGLQGKLDPEQQKLAWRFLRVMRVNGFDRDGDGVAIYPCLSRANHSCDPNTTEANSGENKLIIALRDIQAGEQITIGYLFEHQLLEPRVRRRAYLAHWGFTCSCSACSVPMDQLRAFQCVAVCGGYHVVDAEEAIVDCNKCGERPDAEESELLLSTEVSIVNGVQELEQANPASLEYEGHVHELFEEAEEILSEMHWGMARLHHLSCNCRRRTGDYPAALVHAAAELRFWEQHMRRPSYHIACTRELRGDLLVQTGHLVEACQEYMSSLQTFHCIGPLDSDACSNIHKKLEGVAEKGT